MVNPSTTIEPVAAVVPSPNQIPIFEELEPASPPPRRRHLRVQPPLLADLTPRQRKAVTWGDGPLLVVAGAGTGKTTVLTRRIAWLIAEQKARPVGDPGPDLHRAGRGRDAGAGRSARSRTASPIRSSAPSTPSVIGSSASTGWPWVCRTRWPSCRDPSRSPSCASTSTSFPWTDSARWAIPPASCRRWRPTSPAPRTRTSRPRPTARRRRTCLPSRPPIPTTRPWPSRRRARPSWPPRTGPTPRSCARPIGSTSETRWARVADPARAP